MQHLDHGVARLPAVSFVIRIEDLDPRLGRIEDIQQTPGRQHAADQIGEPTLSEFFQRDDAEELGGEALQLFEGLPFDMGREGILELLLEIRLAGSGEKRHNRTPS